jgi:multidrug efflux pump subunit AcrA (membrane-fusion protein)
VYVRTGSGFEERRVETGQSSLGRVVVIGGLRAGERIALRDPSNPLAPSDSSAPRPDDASREVGPSP